MIGPTALRVRRSRSAPLLLVFACCILLPARGRAQGALSVPVGSPIYDDLEHFRAAGLWHGSLEIRPLTREEVDAIVRSMEAAPKARDLSPRDRSRLDRLAGTIASLMDRERPGTLSAPARGSAPVGQGGGTWRFPPTRWELGAAIQATGDYATVDSLADLKRRPRRDQMFLFHLNAAIGRRLTVESRFYEDYSRLTPYPGGRHWVDNFPPGGEGILTDPSARNDRAILGYSRDWFHLRYGRENRHWGAGSRGTLFLSENPFPLDGLSLRIGTRHVSGISLLAQTRRGPNAPADAGVSLPASASPAAAPAGAAGDAYMAAHRIEFHPSWPVRIGFYEAVVFAGRGLDLAYANPVGQLIAISQDIYDRSGADDKKVAGGDLEVDIAPFTFYGEVLLDRLVSLKNATAGGDSEISSWAQLLGLRWADPVGWAGADVQAEYAHLDPQVYFHKDRDPGRALLSEGELIGHWAGPNADDFYLAVKPPPSGRRGSLTFALEQVRWGLIDGQRGLATGFIGLLKKDKRWITGEKQIERVYSAEWRRCGWKTALPGSFDTDLIAAWIDRTGPAPAGASVPWAQKGWQLEAHLTWNLRTTVHEEGERRPGGSGP